MAMEEMENLQTTAPPVVTWIFVDVPGLPACKCAKPSTIQWTALTPKRILYQETYCIACHQQHMKLIDGIFGEEFGDIYFLRFERKTTSFRAE